MKNLQKHFANITKKVGDFRPALKNIFYDEIDNHLKATDSFRALTFKNGFEIEKSVMVNPVTMEYSTGGNYPNIDRLLNEARFSDQELTIEKATDLKELKKVVSGYKNKGTVLKAIINGKDQTVTISDTKDQQIYTMNIKAIYDEKVTMEMVFTGLYLYNMIEFLVDYRKEYSDEFIICIRDSIRPILITDNVRFSYLVAPIRTK